MKTKAKKPLLLLVDDSPGFIILTENEGYKTQCLAKGAVGYVIKSPSLSEVKKIIEDAADRMKK